MILKRDAFGQLVFRGDDGREVIGVRASRAFPITAPDDGISLVGPDGREVHWIGRLDTLEAADRELLTQDLASREFMPEIQRISATNSDATPCTWQVLTDRGETRLVLKTEEDIRRLKHPALLIIDSRGIQFLIRDPQVLDAHSRRILDRFQ